MTDDELAKALTGLSAYDQGSAGSGIHDELLRQRCVAELRRRFPTIKDLQQTDRHQWPETPGRVFLARMVREEFLSEEAIAQGYGCEDVAEFFGWLSERMEFDV